MKAMMMRQMVVIIRVGGSGTREARGIRSLVSEVAHTGYRKGCDRTRCSGKIGLEKSYLAALGIFLQLLLTFVAK